MFGDRREQVAPAVLEEVAALRSLVSEQTTLLREMLVVQKSHLEKLLWEAQTGRKIQVSTNALIAREVVDEVQAFASSRQLSMRATVEAVRDERLSFVRFGDGEMQFMLKSDFWQGMHKNSPELQAALWEVLTDSPQREEILLGFPHVFREFHWNGVWANSWGSLGPAFERYSRVGVAHVTRPVFFQIMRESGVDLWRSVWKDRRVTVITGENSRFTLIPELFDNARSIDFLYSVPRDAFWDLNRVREKVRENDSELLLVALGAAGTVLTSQLAAEGRWVVDVGHISDSYENVFKGGAWPEAKKVTKA